MLWFEITCGLVEWYSEASIVDQACSARSFKQYVWSDLRFQKFVMLAINTYLVI